MAHIFQEMSPGMVTMDSTDKNILIHGVLGLKTGIFFIQTCLCTANYYSHSTAFVQSKDCNANLITAIDSALSLTVIHYSQTTANVQLMTALIAKSDNN